MGASRQENEQRATDALASAGDVINPWDTPIQAVAAALGKTLDESRILVEGMAARKVFCFAEGTTAQHIETEPSLPGFVYQRATFSPDHKSIEVFVRPLQAGGLSSEDVPRRQHWRAWPMYT
jgi:hypothetical protein